ncbi:phage tail protein [Fusobacterium hominis]|uniref:Phage tail protein n=1 Tax=Fusobacterium hominis TaxID=2764326 RepID=A0A7G9GXJ0_9FUSO|nr:phage tail protein [Fusobacterium hominis]QNM15522.1 phage tail protein [Fusobacterium hominis]
MDKIITDIGRDYLNSFPLYNYASSLGSFGTIVFRVAENNLLTPTQFSAQISSRNHKHSRIRALDITEFEIRNLRKVTLPIKLVREFCNLEKTLNTLIRMVENGEHYPLIIARKQFGENNFTIVSMEYNYSETDGYGQPLVLNVTLNLEEYVPRISRITEKKKEEQKKDDKYKVLKDKAIYSANKEVISTLQRGRLW